MKILIDMNLSPEWTGVFGARGWERKSGVHICWVAD
jgi:predicted nuclease of predicted toxin-antitoxin system